MRSKSIKIIHNRVSFYAYKIITIFKNYGVILGIKFIFYRYLVVKNYPWYNIYVKRNRCRTYSLKNDGITFKKITSYNDINRSDLKKLKDGVAYSNLVNFQIYFNNSASLWLAYLNDDVASYCWTKIGHCNRIKIKDNDAYLYDFETISAFRCRGIGTALINYVCFALQKDLISNIWISIHVLNKKSIKTFEKANFKFYKKINKNE